ncbi:MAG: tetratricopeptide repeat protein [Terriglobia bacterium]|jgi:tetratricopeptide (TPR) repeat protein
MFARMRIALLIGVVCVAGLARAAEVLPGLPALSIDDFPREVRQQVQQAYKAASDRPDDPEASGKLAMLLDLYNRPDDAARCYERAQQFGPSVFKWFYYEGNLRWRQKNQAQAVTLFREALRIDPTYLPARLKFAVSLLENANLEESWGVYTAILKDYPDLAEAYYGLGRISSLRGDTAGAIKSLQRAAELFPPYGAAHYALAQADRKLGDRAGAEAQLKLYEANRNLVPPIEDQLRDAMRDLEMAAAAHLERGLELQQVGRSQDAIAETEKAAALDPQLVQAQVNLIILYGRMGNFGKAEEHYQKAVALNPHQFPDAYYDYGVLLMNANRLQEAAQVFRRAIEIKPSYADAHNNLGYLLEREGKLDEAAGEYRKALDANPDFRQAHFNLGRILINKKNFEEGIEQLRQTLTPTDEGTPSYLYALGAAYGRAGNKQQALEYLNQARIQADSFGQKQLLVEIEGDIRKLSTEPHP